MSQQTVRLAPLADVAVDIRGKFFAVLSATTPFLVEFDQSGRQLVGQGSRLSFQSFKRIIFTETSGNANTVLYFCGDAEYSGSIPTQQDGAIPVTTAPVFQYPYLMTSDGNLLTVNATPLSLPSTISISAVNQTRTSFHISNAALDGSRLLICDSASKVLDILGAGEERTFPISQDVQLIADKGTTHIALYYTIPNT